MTVTSHFNLKKNVWFAIIEFVVNIGLVFASYRLVILQDGVQAIGLWSTLFAWTSLIRIGDVGMANATVRFVALRDAQLEASTIRDYIETGVIANAVLFALLAVLGYFALNAFLDRIVDVEWLVEARAILPIMCFGFFLLNTSSVVMAAVQGLHLGFVRSQLSVCGNLVQLAAALLLVPTFGLAGLAWAQVVQYSVVGILAWILVRREAGISPVLPWGFSVKAFKEMLGFSLRAQLANISNGLFEPVSKIFVSAIGGLHVQGLYELAFKTVWLSRNALVAGVAATVPAMTALLRNNGNSARELYRRSLYLITRSVGLLLILINLSSPAISFVWIGNINFLYCEIVFILSIGAFISSVAAPAYILASITGYMRNNIIINLSVITVIIVFGGLFYRFHLMLPMFILISFATSVGSFTIKYTNEKLLDLG